jgi:hypothetical protein
MPLIVSRERKALSADTAGFPQIIEIRKERATEVSRDQIGIPPPVSLSGNLRKSCFIREQDFLFSGHWNLQTTRQAH